MDPSKAVLEWPRPLRLKGAQWFLGFANYYRRFYTELLIRPGAYHRFNQEKGGSFSMVYGGSRCIRQTKDSLLFCGSSGAPRSRFTTHP
ncbi:hypothetical protein FKM82_019144 [Ascaphus truei]